MNFSVDSHYLGKALDVVTAVVSAPRNERIYQETVPHADLLFYDNHSLTRELKVTERTLQRYRKEGKIRSTVIGGKVYYPKNFLILPAEHPENTTIPTAYCRPQSHQNAVPRSRKRPQSRIIDMDRLHQSICTSWRTDKKYSRSEVVMILMRHRKERQTEWSGLSLCPKKIRLTYIPMRLPSDPPYGFK